MQYLSLLLLLPFVAYAHVCMIWPPQRGGWNVATAQPGSDACFQPRAACGTKNPPTTPTDSLFTGTTVYIKLQQNLNHYNPGWPGFLDVAYASGSNHSTDDDFTILAQVPDYWSHSQSSQTNFSIPIHIPSMECEWCTLRVRYHPNKPTEPIFHNCGDVRLINNINKFTRRLFGFVAPSVRSTENQFVEIMSSGQISPTNIQIGVLKRRALPEDDAHRRVGVQHEAQASNLFLSQGVVAVHAASQSVYFLGDAISVWQNSNSPGLLYRYDLNTAKLETVGKIVESGLQWNFLIPTEKNLIGVQQKHVRDYLFAYTVSTISFTGVVTDIGSTVENDTFVNFFWAGHDPNLNQVYILAGDENSLFTLDAVLYTVTSSGTSSFVKVDNSKYTLSNIHIDQITGTIYSISHGLYGKNDWSIVTIDPKTGAVTLKSVIKMGNDWESDDWGGVYNGIAGGRILHTFKWKNTGSTLLAWLDIETGEVSYYTDIDLGVNSEQKLSYLFAI